MEIQNKHSQDQQMPIVSNKQAFDDQSNHQNDRNANLSCNKINTSIYQSRLKHPKVNPGQFVISYNFDSIDSTIKNRTHNLLIGAASHSPPNKINKLHKIGAKENMNKQNQFAFSRLTNNSKSCSKHNHYANSDFYGQQQFRFGGFGGIGGVKQQIKIKPGNKDYNFLKSTESSNLRNNPYDHHHNYSGKNQIPAFDQLSDLNQLPESTVKQSTYNGNQDILNGNSRTNMYSQLSQQYAGCSRLRKNKKNQGLKLVNPTQLRNMTNKVFPKNNAKGGYPIIESYKEKPFKQMSNANKAKRGVYLNKLIDDQQNHETDGSQRDTASKKDKNSLSSYPLNKKVYAESKGIKQPNLEIKSRDKANQGANNIRNAKQRRFLRRGSSSKNLPIYDQDSGLNSRNLRAEDIHEMKTVRKSQSGDFYNQIFDQNQSRKQVDQKKIKNMQKSFNNKNKQVKNSIGIGNRRKIPQQIQYVPNQFKKDQYLNEDYLKEQLNDLQGKFANFNSQEFANQNNQGAENVNGLVDGNQSEKDRQIQQDNNNIQQKNGNNFSVKNNLKNKSIGGNMHQANQNKIRGNEKNVDHIKPVPANKSTQQKQNQKSKKSKARYNTKPKQNSIPKQQGQKGNQKKQIGANKLNANRKHLKTSDGPNGKRISNNLKDKISNTQGQQNLQGQHLMIQQNKNLQQNQSQNLSESQFLGADPKTNYEQRKSGLTSNEESIKPITRQKVRTQQNVSRDNGQRNIMQQHQVNARQFNEVNGNFNSNNRIGNNTINSSVDQQIDINAKNKKTGNESQYLQTAKISPSQSQHKKSPTSKHKSRRVKELMPQQQKLRQIQWNDRFHIEKDTKPPLDPQKKRQIIQKFKQQQRLTHSPFNSSRNSSIHSPPRTGQKLKLSPLGRKRRNQQLVDPILNSERASTDSSIQCQRKSRESSNKASEKRQGQKKVSIKRKTSNQKNLELKNSGHSNSANKSDKQKDMQKDMQKDTQKQSIKRATDLNGQNGQNGQKLNRQNSNKDRDQTENAKQSNMLKKQNTGLNNKQRNSSKNSILKKSSIKGLGNDKKGNPVYFKDYQQQRIDRCKQSGQNTIGDQSFWENMKKLQQIQDQQQRQQMEQKIRNNAQKKGKNHGSGQEQQQVMGQGQIVDNQKFQNNNDQITKKTRTSKKNDKLQSNDYQIDQNRGQYNQKGESKTKTGLPQLQRQNSGRNSIQSSTAGFKKLGNQTNPTRISKRNSSPDEKQLQGSQQRQNNAKSTLKNSQSSFRNGNKIQLNPLQCAQSNLTGSFSNRKGPMQETQNNFYNSQKPPSVHIQKSPQKYTRAPLISFLYGLSRNFQQQIEKYNPGQNFEFYGFGCEQFFEYSPKQSIIKQAVSIIASIDSWIIQRILEPINKDTNKIGIWLFCHKTWKCFTLNYQNIQSIFKLLDDALKLAKIEFYPQKLTNQEQFTLQQVLKMISGIKILQLKNSKRTYKQVQSNIKRNNVVKAMVVDLTHCQGSSREKDLRCCDVTKVQTTAGGSNVVQIRLNKVENQLIKNPGLSQTQDKIQSQIDNLRQFPREKGSNTIWIKQEKFLQVFKYFLLVGNRQISYWTYFPVQMKKNYKSVYQIQSNVVTNGSISLHFKAKKRATLLFYKEIEPKVLKFVGKVSQKNHGQNINFDFTIKGSYYLFIESDSDDPKQQYLLSYEGSSQVSFEFCQFVKSQTLKNQDCEYVEMMKVKKNGFDKFSQIKERFIDFLMKK